MESIFKKWVPELKGINGKAIRDPYGMGKEKEAGYPKGLLIIRRVGIGVWRGTRRGWEGRLLEDDPTMNCLQSSNDFVRVHMANSN